MFRDYLSWKDYGVRGMKKGKHEMARDPEYLKRLKGLNGAPVSNVNYGQVGLDNISNRNAINKRGAIEWNAVKNGLTSKDVKKLEALNKRTKDVIRMKKNVAKTRAKRAKEMAAYNEEMRKYKKNQKLLNLGITNKVVAKPEMPKSVAEHKAAGERRRAQKISNANQRAARQAQYANVRNELSSKSERPTGYKQKSMLSRIGSGLSKHKGKAALAGLGLGAVGAGLAYAKRRGAFDSNYNILKIKRGSKMNVYQKIKFLKHRRHMDALRIKRLRRHNDINNKAVLALLGVGLGIGTISTVLAYLFERLILLPISHNIDIRDIYEGKMSEKEFVDYIQFSFKRKQAKFYSDIFDPGIEPKTYSEHDYQELKQKVFSAKTAKDLLRLFPDNQFLRDAVKAFEFRKQNKLKGV